MKYFSLVSSFLIFSAILIKACPMGEEGYSSSYTNSSNSEDQEKRIGCLAVTQEYFKSVKENQEKKKEQEKSAKNQQAKKKE